MVVNEWCDETLDDLYVWICIVYKKQLQKVAKELEMGLFDTSKATISPTPGSLHYSMLGTQHRMYRM